MHLLQGFDQVGYVTNDIDLAAEIMQRDFGTPAFRRHELSFPARVGGVEGVMGLKVGVAELNGLKIELLQPTSDVNELYSHRLAHDRPAGLAFHHTGVRIGGDDTTLWDERYAALEKAGKVYYTGEMGPNIKFVYVDERATLGHFVEHSWVRPGTFAKA